MSNLTPDYFEEVCLHCRRGMGTGGGNAGDYAAGGAQDRGAQMSVTCEKTPNTSYGPSGFYIACSRKATMVVNGKHFCTQHGKRELGRAETQGKSR